MTTLGEKKAGTANGVAASKLILASLKAYIPSDRLHLEKFTFNGWQGTEASITSGGLTTPAHLYDNTGTEGSTVEGELIYVGRWITPRQRKKLRGKIVVAKQNSVIHRMLQIKIAYEHRAAGVIYISRSDDHIARGLGYPYALGKCNIPAVGITRKDWRELKESEPQKVRIGFSATTKEATGTNIIVDINPEGRNLGVILIGAHYDSWYTGAQDNCIAVQLLADLLQELSASRDLRHTVRGIFFDAEEVGLLGSDYHASHNDTGQYRFYVNLEMPLPTIGGRLNTLFYSQHRETRQNISWSRLIAMGYIPIPLSLYYNLVPGFPADLHTFYVLGIPAISTYCRNIHQHTPLDSRDNLLLDKYDRLKDYFLATIQKIDRQLDTDNPAVPLKPNSL